MKEIIEEKGVRATITFEIIDQHEFNKHLKKEFINATGVNYDWSCLVHTLEQAEKSLANELKAMENENGHSQIDLFLCKLAWKKLINEFKSGKRKNDYGSYEEQQNELQQEQDAADEMTVWDKKQSDRWNAENMEDVEDCFNCRYSSLHLGHGGLYCSKTYAGKGIIDSTGICEKFIKDRRPK
jgi:hypothetical protein